LNDDLIVIKEKTEIRDIMVKKLAFLSGSLLFLTSSVFGQEAGLIPLLFSQLLGFNNINFTNVLATTATFGFISLMTYFFFKLLAIKFVESVDFVDERDLFGGQNGRNLVAIFAVLFSISGIFGFSVVMDASAMTLLDGYMYLAMLALVFALLGGLSFLILGGIGTTGFSIGAGTGVASKSISSGVKAADIDGIKEGIGSAKKMLNRGENYLETGDYTDAEKAFEEAIEELEQLETATGKDIQELEQEIIDAREELEDAIEIEDDEDKRALDSEKRLKRLSLFFKNITNDQNMRQEQDGWYLNNVDPDELANDTYPTRFVTNISGVDQGLYPNNGTYGVGVAKQDISALETDLKVIQGDFEEESGEVIDAYQKTHEAAVKGAQTQYVLGMIKKLLNEVERDSEEFEQIEQKRGLKRLYQRTESGEQEEKEMEEIIDKLEGMESDLDKQVEKAIEEMEKITKYDDKELEELKTDLSFDERLESDLEKLEEALINSNQEPLAQEVESLRGETENIHDMIQKLLGETQKEDQNVRRGIDDIINDIRSTDASSSSGMGSIAQKHSK